MTSMAFLEIEVQAHSALATSGRIRALIDNAQTVVIGLPYVSYLAFRTWRRMRSLASLIDRREDIAREERAKGRPKPSEEEVSHALALLHEVHAAVYASTRIVRSTPPLRVAYGPFLPAIERDTAALRDYLDDVEMRLSPEFRGSLQTAIAELKPPSGIDWRDTLGTMRN